MKICPLFVVISKEREKNGDICKVTKGKERKMNNYVFSSFERRWRKCVKVGIFSVERKRD